MSCGGQAGVRRDAQRERMSLISEHISLATRSAFQENPRHVSNISYLRSERGADAVEVGDLVFGKRQLRRRKQVGELLGRIRADDGRGYGWPRHPPSKCNGRLCGVVSLCAGVECFEYGKARGVHVLARAAGAGALRRWPTGTVFAGEKTRCQRLYGITPIRSRSQRWASSA